MSSLLTNDVLVAQIPGYSFKRISYTKNYDLTDGMLGITNVR